VLGQALAGYLFFNRLYLSCLMMNIVPLQRRKVTQTFFWHLSFWRMKSGFCNELVLQTAVYTAFAIR
jgi:hypothetical protein